MATGLWHYYLITGDEGQIANFYPVITKALNYVITQQTSEGDIQWAHSKVEDLPRDALVTACSSILRSFACGVQLAKLLGDSNNEIRWRQAAQKLGHALGKKPWRFDRTWEPKTRFSMDWFYPVLSGALPDSEAVLRIDSRWHEFVEPGVGCRCVSDEPWMTVAETCELCLALVSLGRLAEARQIHMTLMRWQDDDGGFWTGYNFKHHQIWPREKTSWTGAAFLLAADAIYGLTSAKALFTQVLTPDFLNPDQLTSQK